MLTAITNWFKSLLSHNQKTVAQVMQPLTDIHAGLDKLATDAAKAASDANDKADALRQQAHDHVVTASDASAAKATLATLIPAVTAPVAKAA